MINLIRNEFVFKVYVKLHKINNLKASTYKLNESMSLKEIVETLQKGNSYNPDEIRITFKEGKNIRWFAKKIEDKNKNKEEDV